VIAPLLKSKKTAPVRACRIRRFALNLAQKRLEAGPSLDQLGELAALPRPSSWIKGKEGKGNGGERKTERERNEAIPH